MTHPVTTTAPPPLGERYYLDHFRAVVSGVRARYGFLLDESERVWLRRLDALPEPALCLYARLANRRGPCFRISRLAYPEIGELGAAVAILLAEGFLRPCDTAMDAATRARLLDCFTHPELRQSLAPHGAPRNGRKPQLLGWLDGWSECDRWLAAFLREHPSVRLPEDDPWPWLRFLFFGERTENLSGFVTRDLGVLVPEAIDPASLAPHFASRREAEESYRLAGIYEDFRHLRDLQGARETLAWWRSLGIARNGLPAPARHFHDRLVDRLGRRLEREGAGEAAEALYATAPVAPCRERRARLRLKAGDRDGALALCHAMRDAPGDAEEAYAAAQLIARIERRARRTDARAYHTASPLLRIDYPESGVEAAVLAHHAGEGWHGVHAENWLWNALFGLLLWDVIYDPSHGGFHSPLQFAPSDLMEPDFYTKRAEAIEMRLALLADPDQAKARCVQTHAAKQGLANPFVFWHPATLPIVDALLQRVPARGSAAVLRRMAQDLRRRRRGFPDLFLWRGEREYRFVEVKSETDHLSPHQYQWLRFFAESGLDVTLERIHRTEMV